MRPSPSRLIASRLHLPSNANQQRVKKQAGNSLIPACFRVSRESAKPSSPVQIRAAPPTLHWKFDDLSDSTTKAARRSGPKWSQIRRVDVDAPCCTLHEGVEIGL